ncbi:MAG TPA: hypothetical protein VJS15_08900 [Allosphingosinicella sp.]|nr:hypothetical protein [Allosphingosinicella sp.]
MTTITREELEASDGSSIIGYLAAGTDAVPTTVEAQLQNAFYINVRNFRDGGDSDDGPAITRAAAYAKSLRSFVSGTIGWQRRQAVLHFPPNLVFAIAEPVKIPGNVSVVMESPVVVTAADDAVPGDFGDYDAWIDIGEDVASYSLGSRWCRYDLSVIRATHSDWSSLDDLGVRLQNIASSQIRLNRVLGFARSVELFAGAYSVAYNHVSIGELRGARHHLTLNAGPRVAPFNDQFVSANQFYGGEFANGSGEAFNGFDVAAIWIKGGNETGYTANTFFGQSYELAAGNGEKLPVWIEGFASSQVFLQQRTENSDVVHMRIDDPETSGCVFQDQYHPYDPTSFEGHAPVIEDNSRAQANLYSSQAEVLYDRLIPVWDSGMIAKRSNQYDGSTSYAVGGFDIAASDFTMYPAQNLIDISGNALRFESGRDLVRWIDTSVNKRFVIFVDTGDRAKVWVPCFRPYDSSGSLLAPVDVDPTGGTDYQPSYVNGINPSLFYWNPGIYTDGTYAPSGAITANHLFVSVRPEVAKVAFTLRGSGSLGDDSALRLKSVRIMAVDSPCASWIETRAPFDNGEYIGTAAPTAGAWKRGTRVYSLTPSASGTEGWVCVSAGTPGTWKAFGTIAA